MSTKPDASSRRTVVHRRREVDRAEPAVADRGKRPLDRRDVADPAALGDEPAAGSQDRRQVREQRVVVEDPVEGRGGQDRVHRLVERERTPEVRHDVLDPVAERRQPLAGRVDHRRRTVERDDVPAGQARRPGAR